MITLLSSVPLPVLGFVVLAILAIIVSVIRRLPAATMANKLMSSGVQVKIDAQPPGPYAPGDTVQVTVRVAGEKEVKFHEGRLTCIQLEQFVHKETTTDSNGNEETETRTETHSRELDPYIFMQDGTVNATEQVLSYKYTLPQDALPTFQGDSLHVRWLLRAVMSRPLAPDVKAETELGVVSVPPSQNAPMTGGTSDHPDDEELSISLPQSAWMIGDTIQGKLLVNPKKNFDVKQVTVTLWRTEYFGTRRNFKSSAQAGQVELATKDKFVAGQSREYPFTLAVPSNPVPSMNSAHSMVEWSLEGSLERGFLNTNRVHTPLVVFSGAPKTQTA